MPVFFDRATGHNFRKKLADLFNGTFEFQKAVRYGGVITPAALTGNTNNWNPTGLADARIIRMSSTGSINLTGLAAQPHGTVVTLMNVGSDKIFAINESGLSDASARFVVGSDVDLLGLTLWYDGVSARWRRM